MNKNKHLAIGIGLGALFLSAASGNGCESVPEESFAGEPEGPALRDIVGGHETGYNEWKGAVLVYGGGKMGSATLIDPQVVITAGHVCDQTASVSELYIMGGPTLDNHITYATGAERVYHPSYNRTNGADDFDICMIKLSTSVTNVETHCVRSTKAAVGTSGWIVGYGESGAGVGAYVHRAGEAALRNNKVAQYVNAPQYLEVGNPAGACSGDSGGPFFTEENNEWAITGVAVFVTSSAGYQCDPGAGHYYVDTVYTRDWIEQTMQQLTGHGLRACSDTPDTDTGNGGTDTGGTDTSQDTNTGSGAGAGPGTGNDTDTDTSGGTGTDTDANVDTSSDGDADAGEGWGFGSNTQQDCGCRVAGFPVRSWMLSALLLQQGRREDQ